MNNYERLAQGLAEYRARMRDFIALELQREFPAEDWLRKGVLAYLTPVEAERVRASTESVTVDVLRPSETSPADHLAGC